LASVQIIREFADGVDGRITCRGGRLFYAMAGKPHEIDARRSRDGRHRYKTKRQVRELLAVD
jgi:hypothetical protein